MNPTNPGELFANIPGILGYYPSESLIFLAFESSGNHKYTLGPVLRLDLADVRYAYDAGDAMRCSGASFALALIVSERSTADDLRDLVASLQQLCQCDVVPIAATWWCEAIRTGTPYHLLDASSVEVAGRWEHGTIGAVSASLSMKELVAEGELPELSREEAKHALGTWNEALTVSTRLKLTQRAWKRARAREADHPESYVLGWPECAQDLRAAITQVASSRHGHTCKALEAIETVASWLAITKFRDAAMLQFLEEPEQGACCALIVANSTIGPIRANAYCAYAVCLLERGACPQVPLALELAREAAPEHRLAGLLSNGLVVGAAELLIESVKEGGRMTIGQDDSGNIAA